MFRFRIADGSDSDIESWYQLRSSIYLEEGYLTAVDLDARGSYRDKYDDYSIHVLATDNVDRPVGCVRMIEGQRGALQVADQFGITTHGRRCLEVSACIVVPEYRKSLLTMGLFRTMFEINADYGFDQAFAILAEEYLAAVKDSGIPLTLISERRYLYNSVNFAAALEVNEIVSSLRAADNRRGGRTKFAEFFVKDFAWTMSLSDVLRDPITVETNAS